ncbi:MAG: MraY family glycosyltransferase [Candidatus Dojkabacteria bacterium]
MHFEPYVEVLPLIILSFVTALAITPFLRWFGLRYGFATKPKAEWKPDERNAVTVHHTKRMSRLGEFAMLIPLGIFMWQDLSLNIQVLGFVLAAGLIAVIGAFDSKYNLNEFVKLFILIFSGIILIFTGTMIDINSIVQLSWLPEITINNPVLNERMSVFSMIITLMWIVVVPYALSLVGGVDGLSEGTTTIALMILVLIGIRNGDTFTIVIGSVCLGGMLGLLPYNFHPAMIFSEHLIFGFIIAVLSVTSQAKIATSILILTVPLIDFIFVHYLRTKKYFSEQKKFNFRLLLHYYGTGDRNHLHHKLMDLGMKPAHIALFQYILYAVLGFAALVVSGLYLTLVVLGSIVLVVLILCYINYQLNKIHKDT